MDPILGLLFNGSGGSGPAPQLATLDAALVARVADQLVGTLNPPRLWAEIDPTEPPATPYLTYDDVSGTLGRAADGTSYVDGQYQLVVWSNSKAEAKTVARLVAEALEDAPLAYLEGRHMLFRATGPAIADLDPEPDANGLPLWRAVTTYRFMFQRS